jgi:FHA domain
MLFHHSNGSCYVVDCGSAHGTYVNGVRVVSPATNDGVVVPHKVRRGAMIRFGGPGAPVYVLKSFSFRLPDLAEVVNGGTNSGELIRRNTRLNALGKTATETVRSYFNQNDVSCMIRKRSFDSLCSEPTLCFDEESLPSSKRMRCSSPPLELEVPARVVSPDLASLLASKPRRVRFSPAPPQCFFPTMVTPDASGEEDNDDVSL